MELMSGYVNLAPYYAALFPLSESARGFLAPYADRCLDAGAPWLDVGAGTGAALGWLVGRGVDAYGVEPDSAFLEEARQTLSSRGAENAAGRVLKGGMGDVSSLFPNRRFGAISCLGNVLAHAPGPAALREALGAFLASLTTGGSVLVQVVNFDRALSADWTFPALEKTTDDGRRLEFERRYRVEEYRPGGTVVFETRLRIDDGESIDNATRLHPIRKSEIEEIAAGVFRKFNVYGDFERSPWRPDSPATVLVGEEAK